LDHCLQAFHSWAWHDGVVSALAVSQEAADFDNDDFFLDFCHDLLFICYYGQRTANQAGLDQAQKGDDTHVIVIDKIVIIGPRVATMICPPLQGWSKTEQFLIAEDLHEIFPTFVF
jgi:hypothetical protein